MLEVKVGDFFRSTRKILRCNKIVNGVIYCTDGYNVPTSDVKEIIYTKVYLQIKDNNFVYVEPKDVNMHQLYFDASLQNIKFTKDISVRLSCGNYISIGSHVIYKGELYTVENFKGSEILIQDASGNSTEYISVTRKDFSIPQSFLKYHTDGRGSVYIEDNNLLYSDYQIKVVTEGAMLNLEEVDGSKIKFKYNKYYSSSSISNNIFICNGVIKQLDQVNFYLEDCFPISLDYIPLIIGDIIKWVGPEDHKGAFPGEAKIVEVLDNGVTILMMHNGSKKDLWKYLKHIELVKRTKYMDKYYHGLSTYDKEILLRYELLSDSPEKVFNSNLNLNNPEEVKEEPKPVFYNDEEIKIKIQHHLLDRTTYAGANNLSRLNYYYKKYSKEELSNKTIFSLNEREFLMFSRCLDKDTDIIASPIEKRYYILSSEIGDLISEEGESKVVKIFDDWEM